MWPYPRIIAHRGGGTLAPENTLAGVRRGMQAGFRAIEFDVMLARDGVPVVLHDPKLGKKVAASGHVFDHDALALAACDAGAWFSPAFAGEPVPLFVEFAQFCRAHGVWMNIELKPAPGFDAQTGAVVARLAAALFADDVTTGRTAQVPLLSSFSAVALDAARAVAPELPRAWLLKTLPADWAARARALGVVALHVRETQVTAARAGAIKAAGFGLFCYTVNQPSRARELLGWGVDAICTDNLDVIGPDFI